MKDQHMPVAQRVSPPQPGLAGVGETALALALLGAAGAGEVLRTDIGGWSITALGSVDCAANF